MKNREKYKNELINVIKKDSKLCEFVKKHEVFRMFGNDSKSYCKMTCGTCGVALNLWLDEECEEPEVDWSKVTVDTLVRVRDNEDQEWILRYFKGINKDILRPRYEAWCGGSTSKTANGRYLCWEYCELVEDEDDGSK